MESIKHDTKLKALLDNFELDIPGSALTFSQRLARDNGWTQLYAIRVVEEYKKFVYLSVITGKSLTPSDEVDQAWHMHLIYSRSYADMCKLIGREFHHGPTKGGHTEGVKYTDQYNNTLSIYHAAFGGNAPSDIWPDTHTRFSNTNFKRVNVKDNIILDRRKVKAYALSLLLVPVLLFMAFFLMSAHSKEKPVNPFFIVGGLILVVFILRGIYRYANKSDRKKSGSSSSSSSSDSGCGVMSSFFGCGSDSGCGSSGCGSSDSGCGSSGCSGCGGCGGD